MHIKVKEASTGKRDASQCNHAKKVIKDIHFGKEEVILSLFLDDMMVIYNPRRIN